MHQDSLFDFDKISVFIFDFDGVLTNNIVFVDQCGIESVACSRADGLAFDVLRRLKKQSYILSTEKNQAVKARANKLKVPVIQGVNNKVKALKELKNKEGIDFKNALYMGNDLNDYQAMRLCGISVCPADSHPKIKEISDIVLKTNGGNGVVRELLEDVFGLDFIEILYKE
jgi:3-deoxy-D-manno-octulosonate 8-phosphate phosphatase (KDO 8-P phosphatase)